MRGATSHSARTCSAVVSMIATKSAFALQPLQPIQAIQAIQALQPIQAILAIQAIQALQAIQAIQAIQAFQNMGNYIRLDPQGKPKTGRAGSSWTAEQYRNQTVRVAARAHRGVPGWLAVRCWG